MEVQNPNARRKALQTAVSCLCSEAGFDGADKVAIETLTEMLQSFMTELGSGARALGEVAGRCEPVIGDVVLALVEMGFPISSIEAHARRNNRTSITPPAPGAQPKALSILQAGQKKSVPPHIPDYLPPLPDPHAYIRTPTHKQPVTEYEAVREKAASQKRDIERALTRFIAKTGKTHSLFPGDDGNMFLLVACKPCANSYLTALIPKDQVFDYEEEYVPKRRREEENEEEDGDCIKGERGESTAEADIIDNPYLRPVKMPRKKK